MIQTIDLKKGMVFERGGKLLKVLQINHHKPGKGNTLMQMDIQDVRTGSIVHTTMRPSEKVEQVNVDKKNAQYLYDEGNTAVFMDMETYEQLPIDGKKLGDAFRFVKENMEVKVLSYKGSVFAVEPPLFVELEITETEPGVKGNTATNVLKPATVETGAVVKVPIFIEQGERIQIDTRTGEYLGRSKK